MPLGKGIRYRYKKGTKIRLAFRGNQVVEAKNMSSGKVHTSEEFSRERKVRAKKILSHR